MAFDLPVEGEEGPFVGQNVTAAATCEASTTVGGARRSLDETGADTVIVTDHGLAVGEVDAEVLGGADDSVAVLDVMHPVPSTYRPSVTVSSLAGAHPKRVVVTTPDGRLLGEAQVDPELDGEKMERELSETMEAVADHFGDHEPSDTELRSFLRDRLVAQGRSPEEADQFMADLEDT